MEKSTKIALFIAASGYAINRYENNKIDGTKTYLETSESQAKMLGGLVGVLGIASAGILELTKNNPKARKITFIGLGGLTIAGFVSLMYALKKMT
jgi:hypothetical protein